MPPKRQRRRRKQNGTQQRAPQITGGCQSDQAWLDDQQTDVQRLATELQRRRNLIAQAQQLFDERSRQHTQETQQQSGTNTTMMEQAPARDKGRARGRPRKDGTETGQIRNASPRPRRPRAQGRSPKDGQRAGQTRQAAHRPMQQQRGYTPDTVNGSGYTCEYLQPGQQQIAPTTLYTKAYKELLMMLGLQQPPIEPTARKLFDTELMNKVKRIMKSQKERERRRAKAKAYKQKLFNY